MKKIGLGIAIILFGILLEQSLDMPDLTILIGIAGLIFAIVGFVSKEDK